MLVCFGEGTRPQAELGGVKQVLSKLLHKYPRNSNELFNTITKCTTKSYLGISILLSVIC